MSMRARAVVGWCLAITDHFNRSVHQFQGRGSWLASAPPWSQSSGRPAFYIGGCLGCCEVPRMRGTQRGGCFLGILGGLFVSVPASGTAHMAFSLPRIHRMFPAVSVQALRGNTARPGGDMGRNPRIKMVLADPPEVHTTFRAPPKGSKEPTAVGQKGLSIFQNVDELGDLLGGTGKAKMVWESINNGVDPFENAEVVTEKARALLKESFLRIPPVAQETVSRDGTTKLLLSLEDGLQVEAVVIPNKGRPSQAADIEPRTTLCVSSQVGCNRACDFCATGKMGFIRQLTSHEILSQAFHGLRVVRERNLPKLHNIVFMGMGEPLNNLINVMHATSILTDHKCFKMARQRVTVSTVGPSPAAIRAAGDLHAMLAWSVHAADDTLRRKLVPTTAHKMADLRDTFQRVLTSRSKTMSTFMVAVTLISGVNDGIEEADKLVELLQPLSDQGIKICVDLIPYNSIGVDGFEVSSKDTVSRFQRRVRDANFACFVRVTRGDDENAACGQLATKAKRVGSKIMIG